MKKLILILNLILVVFELSCQTPYPALWLKNDVRILGALNLDEVSSLPTTGLQVGTMVIYNDTLRQWTGVSWLKMGSGSGGGSSFCDSPTPFCSGTSTDGSLWEFQLGSSSNYWNISLGDQITSFESQVGGSLGSRNMWSIEDSDYYYGLIQDNTGFHYEGAKPPVSLLDSNHFITLSDLDSITIKSDHLINGNILSNSDTIINIFKYDDSGNKSQLYMLMDSASDNHFFPNLFFEGNIGTNGSGDRYYSNYTPSGLWFICAGDGHTNLHSAGESNMNNMGYTVYDYVNGRMAFDLNIHTGLSLNSNETFRLSSSLLTLKNNNTNVFRVDSSFVRYKNPHYNSIFMDSSRVISLDLNTPKIISNEWGNLWPSSEMVGFTENNDTIIVKDVAGGYNLNWRYNASASASANYRYYLRKKTGSTVSTLYKITVANSGTQVERGFSIHAHLAVGDRIWVDIENITNSTDVTVYSGSFYISAEHLNF